MTALQIFNRYLEAGGEEKSVYRIADHLELSGHEVERFWISSEEWLKEGRPSRLTQVRRMFANVEFEERLAKKIRSNRPDYLLAHNIYPVASPSVYRFAQQQEIPLIQYIHNFRPFSVGGSLWANGQVVPEGLTGNHRREIAAGSWQNSVFKSAVMGAVLWNLKKQGWLDSVTQWVAISDFMRTKFIEAGIPAEKVATLRHSWDPKIERNHHEEGDYYLFLSRLVPEKGIQDLLVAWDLLEKQMGKSCPQLLIGGTGSEEELVKKAAEKSDKVQFLGFVSGQAKGELIAKCRAMLAPSVWWEPLGLVTYEAYDNEKPMVAARSGGLTETIEHGVTGLLHEPADPAALMNSLLEMEKLGADSRKEMGQAGRDWLLREASPERWRNQFEELLSKF